MTVRPRLSTQAGLCEPSGDIVDVVQDAGGVGWSATCVDGGPQLSCQPMQGAPVQPGSWHAAFGTVD